MCLLLYSSLEIIPFIILCIFYCKLPNPSISSKDLKFWTQHFVSNFSSLKALNKYLFVSINENLWKHLNIFVSISILSGVLPSSHKTLILLVNFLTTSICLHIDISNCSILFTKISFFIESPQHSHAYRMNGFTKESKSFKICTNCFLFWFALHFMYWKLCFLVFLNQVFNANTFFSDGFAISVSLCPIIKLINFFYSILLLIKYDDFCFLQIKI